MANDPHRDVLPVKETQEKFRACERIEFASLSKFRRTELEDRFYKLYEENNELKKLTHSQEGKIKKLGTKLLKVLGDKKNPIGPSRRNVDDIGLSEELQMRVMELEHENYSLKDKNTVLKQQLASHSKQHMAAHRSPVRIHPSASSPRPIRRPTSVPNINEGSITLSTRQQSSERQLRDDDAQLIALFEQNKSLNSQIEYLQTELEKSVLANQKIRVGENIELIKLRRQTKQLEAQLRSAQYALKLSQDDCARLQKENEEALQIIAEKQNEIIDYQGKVEESLKSDLEWQELKETIADIKGERDLLRERCDVLMKTVQEAPKETETIQQLERLLTAELSKTAKLKRQIQFLSREPLTVSKAAPFNDSSTQTAEEQEPEVKLGLLKSTEIRRNQEVEDIPPYNIFNYLNRSHSQSNGVEVLDAILPNKGEPTNQVKTSEHSINPASFAESKEVQTSFDRILPSKDTYSERQAELIAASERFAIEKELNCVRELLRAETQRCDYLENQVRRQEQELGLNQMRYNDVFQQRDLFFKLLDQGHRLEPACVKSSEDYSNLRIDSNANGKNAGTYVKNTGTYTKNSPVKVVPSVTSSELMSGHEGDTAPKCSEPITTIQPSDAPPVPVPRSRASSSKGLKEPIRAPNLALNNLEANEDDKSNRNKPAGLARHRGKEDDASLEPAKEWKESKDESPSVTPAPIEVNAQIVKNLAVASTPQPKIQVSILWVQLDGSSRIFQDLSIKALYVDFSFLGNKSTEFETPQAVPKPVNPIDKCLFNYTTDITLTEDIITTLKEYAERKVLVFNLVSEPPGDESQVECIDVGTCSISSRQFFSSNDDEELNLPLMDVSNPSVFCGTLAVRLCVPHSLITNLQMN